MLVRASYRLGPGTLTAGWQGDYGRDIDRPRNNSTTVRFYYPEENSSRFTLNWETGAVAGFSRIGFIGFLGSYDQITNQYRFATPDAAATLEQADVSANDFQARGFAERFIGPVRFEVGVDINGRYDLHALDNFVRYTVPPEERSNVSVEDAAQDGCRRLPDGRDGAPAAAPALGRRAVRQRDDGERRRLLRGPSRRTTTPCPAPSR